MQFWQFMFVPTILFMTVVAPIWIVMHYRSLRRSSRSLNEQDRHALEELLATVDRLTERIDVLETILDSDHASWRDQTDRQRRDNKE